MLVDCLVMLEGIDGFDINGCECRMTAIRLRRGRRDVVTCSESMCKTSSVDR
jgi:hypothetical protein